MANGFGSMFIGVAGLQSSQNALLPKISPVL